MFTLGGLKRTRATRTAEIRRLENERKKIIHRIKGATTVGPQVMMNMETEARNRGKDCLIAQSIQAKWEQCEGGADAYEYAVKALIEDDETHIKTSRKI